MNVQHQQSTHWVKKDAIVVQKVVHSVLELMYLTGNASGATSNLLKDGTTD